MTALLVAEDRQLAEQFLSAVTGARVFEVLAELKGYPEPQTLEMRLRQIQPDVLVVDLAGDFDKAASLIRSVGSVQPPVQIIGLHHRPDPDVLIRSFRAGASEFLSAPFDAGAQKEAAARIRRLKEPEDKGPQECGNLVAWSSAKPGAGASTLATQFAFALRRLTGQRVLLVDLDLFGGAIAFHLKIAPTYTVLDAVERSGRLDPGVWSAFVANASGIDLLAAPENPVSAEIEFSGLHDVLEYARVLYDWVVVDLPVVFQRLSLFVMSEADSAYLVSTAELTSLHLARRAVGMLSQLGYGKDRFQMIVNRMDRKTDLSPADMAKIFTCPVFASLPNDQTSLHKVVTRAEILPRDCELGRALEQVTAKIAGLVAAGAKSRGGLVEPRAVLSEG